MKIFVMLAAAFLGFINLFIPILPEHKDDADWIVDGEYFGYFYDEGCEEKVMNQFMGLVEEENIDGMFNIFSKNVRADCPTTLKKSLPELADFLNNRVASWEYRSSYSNRGGGAGPADRVMLFDLHTEEGLYRFTIRDYIAFSHSTGKSTANSGFRSITIIPEELHSSYMGFCYEKDGVHIVYRADGGNEAAVKGQERMENWMELAEAGDVDGFYEQFAPVVKNGEGMDGLPEKIRELEGFLSNEITSWEPHSWTQYNECYPTNRLIHTSWEESFFDLHTDTADYLCGVYWVAGDGLHPDNIGLRSISLFLWLDDDALSDVPYPTYKAFYDACTLGRDEDGIFIVLEYPEKDGE